MGKISGFSVLAGEYDGGFVGEKLADISVSDFSPILIFQLLENGISRHF